MYQDPEVAHIIRLLDQKKQDMVRQEKYEQAKNLKQAIADLQKVASWLIKCNKCRMGGYNTFTPDVLGLGLKKDILAFGNSYMKPSKDFFIYHCFTFLFLYRLKQIKYNVIISELSGDAKTLEGARLAV